MHNLPALRGEQHDNGEEQADQRPGCRKAEEVGFVTVGAKKKEENQASENGCAEWDAQEDADGGGDRLVGDGRGAAGGLPMRVENANEEQRKRRKENDLKERVDGNQNGAVIAVSAGLSKKKHLSVQGPVSRAGEGAATYELVPDQHHGDAPRHSNQDEAFAEALLVGEKSPSESEL